MSFDLTRVLRPEVQSAEPYQIPAPPPGRPVKLDANESPFALGQALKGELAREFARALADVELHRYPDPSARAVREALAADLGVAPEQLVICNGSDEAIHLLQQLVAPPDAIAIPVPTFAMYAIGAKSLGLRVVEVPLDREFELDCAGFLAAIKALQPRLVFLAWPNNPTGRLFRREAVDAILAACAGRDCHALVAVDEAYFHYSGQTYVPRLRDWPNLVVVRTLSKIGLAGIRLGVLAAGREVIAAIDAVRQPYNVNALSQAAARVILAHGDLVREQAEVIVKERERVARALGGIPGLTVFPSQANFLLVKTVEQAGEVAARLLARGILVRDFSRVPFLANCLRITIGSPAENDALLAALADLGR
jgi:histidinol-phosphate aminotransferase